MNTFAQYHVIEHTPAKLVVRMSRGQQRLHFFAFRVMPWIMLTAFITSLSFAQQMPMGLIYGLSLLALLAMTLLLLKQYVTILTIAEKNFTITFKTLTGTRVVTIPFQDAGFISYRMRRGKGGGLFYYLHTVQDKRIHLLKIPVFWMSREKAHAINSVLEKLTGLQVKEA
jgi:hypothetical protein